LAAQRCDATMQLAATYVNGRLRNHLATVTNEWPQEDGLPTMLEIKFPTDMPPSVLKIIGKARSLSGSLSSADSTG
ncbi:Hypothetical predicted protein, partial [Podarcis lilfordi]